MTIRMVSQLLSVAMLLWMGGGGIAQAEQERSLNLPPESIAQWYKPQNKRQVWLHTMFTLRRSMQAIEEYAALEDGERLDKWSAKFLTQYRSIAEMVPQWADEVEPQWADRLEQAVTKRQWSEVSTALGKLGMTCRSCHQDYRAVTAALYRAPKFDQIVVEDSETLEEVSFKDAMNSVTHSMNGFKIAVDDQRLEAAADHLQRFAQRMRDLGSSCASCHKDEITKSRILGADTTALFDELSEKLQGDRQGIGRKLGELGVVVCARCHGVHRTLSDLTGLLR
ncbi:MAG: cytochrome c [Gammaproteobacteria bacterium]|nr:cytochrome c [Gammaproteobacteria bacterium]MBT3845720.1 cytochrome c [Gammaproteobacteria bacterium]MBT3893661.1 cytochrome c [Gammaproteobacteria bacterium]MBT4300312.1 cytochrome c [Gammaproteobacteria bacterium]MBT5371250.1 cytochrome c [Gammaproteobacteria bacterium]